MKIVLIEAYAEGGYTDSTYEEHVLLPKEVYDKIKEQVEEIEIWVSGLDGKHSEEEAEIYTEVFEDVDRIQNKNWSKEIYNDYNDLHYSIDRILEPLGLDLTTEESKVVKYIKSLDYLIDVTVTVRKSQVPQINEFIDSLKE